MASSTTRRPSTKPSTVSQTKSKKQKLVDSKISNWINNEKKELASLKKDLALHEKKYAEYMEELGGYKNGSAPLEQLAKDENKAIRKITRDMGTCNVRISELQRKLK